MVPIIGLASGLGAGDEGCKGGPLAIKERTSLAADWKELIIPQMTSSDKWEQIPLLLNQLATLTYKTISSSSKRQGVPQTIILGGDHSCGVGTWSGVCEYVRKQNKDLALIWIDAHMDAHTLETSDSGNIHGMPLAHLLGFGSKSLCEILSPLPKIKPENLFLIGTRSYEPPEKVLLDRLGVRIYYSEEVHQRGLSNIISEVTNKLKDSNLTYGLSIDIDAFDPSRVSATGTPVEGGLNPDEFIECYSLFQSHPPVALELCEYNPQKDANCSTLAIIEQLLKKVIQEAP